MENYNIEVNKKYTVTPQDIDDIMVTALEGGINYWCRKAEVVGEYLGEYASDQISRGGSLILYDAESSDHWELNLEKLLYGIQKAIEDNWYDSYNWYIDGELDCCQIDAEVADTIVQLALFDDIVFG
nr:MAG TPA: hypothetical protein [Caudoviricetes sp.]